MMMMCDKDREEVFEFLCKVWGSSIIKLRGWITEPTLLK